MSISDWALRWDGHKMVMWKVVSMKQNKILWIKFVRDVRKFDLFFRYKQMICLIKREKRNWRVNSNCKNWLPLSFECYSFVQIFVIVWIWKKLRRRKLFSFFFQWIPKRAEKINRKFDVKVIAATSLPYGVSFFSILMVLSAVIGGSVGAAVVIGTTIAQSGPAKPSSQWHRFIFVHT